MTVNESKELAQVLHDFQKEYDRAEGVDLCHMYQRVKPVLDKVIPLLPVIPHGTDIAILIKSLSQLLDGFCG